VAVLHASLKARGYEPSDLRVTFYDMKEFELEGPDGCRLWFGRQTAETPTVRREDSPA